MQITTKTFNEGFYPSSVTIEIKVKSNYWNALNKEMESVGCYISHASNDNSHSVLRISKVRRETERAYEVIVECSSYSGKYSGYRVFLPKSVILDGAGILIP